MRFVHQTIYEESFMVPYCIHSKTEVGHNLHENALETELFCIIENVMDVPDICAIYRYHHLRVKNKL